MRKKWYFHRFKKSGDNSYPAMQLFVFLIFFLSLIYAEPSFSQSAGKATVKGKVLDSLSAEPLGFASIRIFDAKESKLVNGNITTEAGDFSIDLPYGRYYAEVEFMGYNAFTTPQFTLSEQHPAHDFGVIGLSASVSTLDEIVVIGFGEREKKDLTGSVATVSAKEIEKIPFASPQLSSGSG